MARNFSSGPDWVQGVVARQLGPLTYLIDVLDGRFWRRHMDLVKKYGSARHTTEVLPDTEFDVDSPVIPLEPPDDEVASDTPGTAETNQEEPTTSTENSTVAVMSITMHQKLSKRIRIPISDLKPKQPILM